MGEKLSGSKSSLEGKRIHDKRRPWQKKSEFVCQSKFRNNLPNPPLGPYFVKIPSQIESYVPYEASSLERSYKWKLHSEKNLGVKIDIIDPRNYLLPDPTPPMDPKDAALIDWHETKGGSGVGGKDSRRKIGSEDGHGVAWLKKTTYLTNDPVEAVHKFKTEQKAQMERQARVEKDLEQHRKTDPLSAVKQSFAVVGRVVFIDDEFYGIQAFKFTNSFLLQLMSSLCTRFGFAAKSLPFFHIPIYIPDVNVG